MVQRLRKRGAKKPQKANKIKPLTRQEGNDEKTGVLDDEEIQQRAVLPSLLHAVRVLRDLQKGEVRKRVIAIFRLWGRKVF